jgi:hypothetical protein
MLRKFWSENLKGRGQSKDTCEVGIVIVECILRNRVERCGLDASG